METAVAPSISFKNLPLTFDERLALPDELRVPATFDAYLNFAERCDYRVEYSKGHIVSMSTPTDTHELLTANIIGVFQAALRRLGFKTYGSNLGVFIREAEAQYKPDVTVLAEEPHYVFHKVGRRTLRSVANPFMVVEVISEGTRGYDFSDKLPDYKKCPSLQHILFVEQNKLLATLFSRTDDPKEWRTRDFDTLEDMISLAGQSIPVRGIYEDVSFEQIAPRPAR